MTNARVKYQLIAKVLDGQDPGEAPPEWAY